MRPAAGFLAPWVGSVMVELLMGLPGGIFGLAELADAVEKSGGLATTPEDVVEVTGRDVERLGGVGLGPAVSGEVASRGKDGSRERGF